MKNKVVWVMAISILIFTVFVGGMSNLRDKGVFYLEDIEGQREYLSLFPLEGVTGDGTHAFKFRLEDGELSAKFYPIGAEQVRNQFFAERAGVKGLKKYSYDYYNSIFQSDINSYADSAPSQDAALQKKEEVHQETVEKGYFTIEDFLKGETIISDKIDVYLNLWGGENGGEARIKTGMTIQDKDYYYTRGYRDNTENYATYSSFDELGMQTYCVKRGDAYYILVGSKRNCKGETSLYRIRDDGLKVPQVPYEDPGVYSREERGEAEVLRSFPVDATNQVIGMFAVGENSLGIFRVENEALLFEIYDLEGNLKAQDLLLEEQSQKIDQTEAEVTVWDDGSVSIYFKMYDVVEKEENSQVWECLIDGIYQVDEKGLKRLKCFGESGGKLLSVCRNNLVLDVYMEFNEEMKIPYNYNYDVYISITNGDTGGVLYQGVFQTDYAEDSLKNFSAFNIAKNAIYLEEAMKTQYMDSIIGQRQRQISDVVPINGRGQSIWWR
ncbi:hypothetical protein [Anaerotignum sp.]|uniref:hypothetical protein n=1 Tax=Anaerotignum sp. TaxID=2039241 RepID=UPI0028A69BCE|nr:hypothetical protein [Anaerotignum sp.]